MCDDSSGPAGKISKPRISENEISAVISVTGKSKKRKNLKESCGVISSPLPPQQQQRQ